MKKRTLKVLDSLFYTNSKEIEEKIAVEFERVGLEC